ncbi:hypothetical protein ANO11243_041950 [Dothideomycetidae sp. 11243]|nr:hypothetical protein ANO11243_041950 [fungal sp. No.11243]
MLSSALLRASALALFSNQVAASPLTERSANPAAIYHGLTASALIPWAEEHMEHGSYNFAQDPHVKVTLNNQATTYRANIDTGSSAFLIGSDVYPGFDDAAFNAAYQNGTEYLSSSNKLYTGYWVPTAVHFIDGHVTTQVKTLVVTKSVDCTDYDEAVGGACPAQQVTGVNCDMNCTLTYMGIGFGRSNDGQSDVTPANNALLNVTSIVNKPVPTNYRPGYIITSKGITVGISHRDSTGFKLVKLQRTSRKLPHDWQGVTGCISVTYPGTDKGTGACVTSQILLDTGIPQSYLVLTTAAGLSNWIKPSGYPDVLKYQYLPTGSEVSITFGEQDKNGHITPEAKYSYQVGANSISTPSYARARLNETAGALGFVNTGRYFYRLNDILFDAEGGYWGIRSR